MGRKRVGGPLDVVVDADGEIRDPALMSNEFVDYFSSIAQNLDNTIPNSNTEPMSYMPESTLNSLNVMPKTIIEVMDTIMKLPNKGGIINSVPVSVFKGSASLIAPLLSISSTLLSLKAYFQMH